MNKPLQCVVTDLDGTLLNPNSEISEEDLNELLRIQANGVPVVIATGRPHFYIKKFVKQLHISDPLICSNGGVILHNEKILCSWALDLNQCKLLIETLLNLNLTFSAHTHDHIYRNGIPSHNPVNDVAKDLKHDTFYRHIGDFKFSPQTEVFKICVFNVSKDMVQKIVRNLPDFEKLQVVTSGYGILDITSVDARKGAALKYVADYMHINPENIVVFGDNENDVSMFQTAGYSVAMGNAIEEVKSSASFVTRNNSSSGVSYALKTYFKNMLP